MAKKIIGEQYSSFPNYFTMIIIFYYLPPLPLTKLHLQRGHTFAPTLTLVLQFGHFVLTFLLLSLLS